MVKNYVDELLQEVEEAFGFRLKFKFGTMVEAVRGCLTAGELARWLSSSRLEPMT